MYVSTAPWERKAAWRALGIFLSITIVFTSVFGGLMADQGGTPRLLVTGVMWSPGIAAILTCLILKRSISSLPWRWGKWRWNWYAWLLPIAYGAVIYLPFWAIGLVSGLIWAIWHWPAILFTDYNAGEGSFVLQMIIFTMAIVPQGIVYAYFAFKSESLWPPVILHASHNLFIQRIYTPLTIRGEDTHFYIDEFGIVMPIVGCLLAFHFYRCARREGIA